MLIAWHATIHFLSTTFFGYKFFNGFLRQVCNVFYEEGRWFSLFLSLLIKICSLLFLVQKDSSVIPTYYFKIILKFGEISIKFFFMSYTISRTSAFSCAVINLLYLFILLVLDTLGTKDLWYLQVTMLVIQHSRG